MKHYTDTTGKWAQWKWGRSDPCQRENGHQCSPHIKDQTSVFHCYLLVYALPLPKSLLLHFVPHIIAALIDWKMNSQLEIAFEYTVWRIQ